MVQEGMPYTLQETGDIGGLSPSTSRMVTLRQVPTKSSPSAVCWRWTAHIGVWLEVDEHRSRVLLAFTFVSVTIIRGGARFEVGWATHICGGCPGRRVC